MTDKELLIKAIEKAEENGFKLSHKENMIDQFYWFDIIFSHDFAKAFFKKSLLGWKQHLQLMVLEKEPLLYLKKFL